MTRRRTLLLVNPTARKGAALTLAPTVESILRAHDWDVRTQVTRSARHAVDLAAQADPDTLLVALGGDGLVGRVAEGALVSGAAVAPLPAGRGHDFIRAVGAPRDMARAAGMLPFAAERRIDVAFAGDTPYLGVATVGYDSLANRHANDAPRVIPSRLVYAYGGSRALWQTRPEPFGLTVDDVDQGFTGWNLAIGNSGRYGAGMRVNPDALLDDGLLDLTTVGVLPRWRYPILLPKLFSGTHIDGVRVRALRGRVVRVTAPEHRPVYADGDPVGHTPMTFRVEPAALRIVA